MKGRVRIGDLLIERRKITQEQLDRALESQKKEGRRLGEILISQNLVSEEDIIEILQEQLDIERITLRNTEIDPKAVKLLSESLCRKYNVFPFGFEHDRFKYENNLKVVFSDPLNIFALDDISFTGYKVKQYISTEEDIKSTIDKFYSGSHVKSAAMELSRERERLGQTKKQEIEVDDIKNAPAVKMIDQILEDAVKQRASDIHIEPYEDNIRIRYRIDGSLKTLLNLDIDSLGALITRIKILSNMNIAEKRVPQDGRIVTAIGDKPIDMRVSTIPLITGEKVVIRILDKGNYKIGKEKLGMSKGDLELLENIIKSPYGIILVTGPTGSGKSTTLYTVLNELNNGNKNITTIEDPVEYTVGGINQVNVNSKAGLTFAAGLRSMLRQDPDIIMIGEMRDGETAQIGIRAAITGHLVLSTLHTNDAASSVLRLIDMGIEPFLVSTALKGVIAQRLVKKNCPSCKKAYEATDTEKEILGINKYKDVILYKGVGCIGCGHTGYAGRIGVYEILQIDRELKDKILVSKNADELKDMAVEKGMKTLGQSCKKLVLKGETTMDELMGLLFLE